MNFNQNTSVVKQVAKAEKLFSSRKFTACLKICKEHTTKHSANLALLDLSALSYLQLGNTAEAIRCYENALKVNPNNFTANLNLAKLHIEKNDQVSALLYLQACLLTDQSNEEANTLMGSCCEQQEKFPEAIDSYSKVITKNPKSTFAYLRIALILSQLKHHQAAIEVLDTGLQHTNDNKDLLYCKALVLDKSSLYTAALRIFENLVETNPDNIEYHFGYAEILRKTNRIEEAEKEYKIVLVFDPQHIRTKINYGNLLCQLKRINEGQLIYEEAYAQDPGNHQILGNIAALSMIKRDFEKSWKYYGLAQKISPILSGSYLYSMAFQCEWSNYHEILDVLKSDDQCEMSLPFPTVIFNTLASRHLTYAQKYADTFLSTAILGPISKYVGHEKIRIGYYSSDFYNHATMMLMEGMFKAHNRERFELYAFSLDHTRADEHNTRARQLFDHYHDVHHLSDRAVTLLSRNLEIDIAIDLKGYTEGSRSAIFAERAAPVQINFLGYPGTMGAQFMDYIVADPYLIPKELKVHYTEKVLYMPDCYQPNNPGRPTIDPLLTRPTELPKDTFVYCCFNNCYKITPEIFTVWMNILHQAPLSVLWLLKTTEKAEINLKKQAAKQGIDPSRIIFADIATEAAHLQRLSHADLFLDTFPCNAHTTASDSLWAGVPLVTISGETFASRVAGSLLKNTGLEELITSNTDGYSDLAIAIYKDRNYLKKLKLITANGIKKGPTYDIDKFTKSFEVLLLQTLKF